MQDVMSGMVFWEGHVVQSVDEQADGSLLINLSEDPERTACCGQCGQACVPVHERRWRRIRERDWFDRHVWLNVIKRTAYGFRDSAYFFLKIKDAFPGKAR